MVHYEINKLYEELMPTISTFYGIFVKMFFKDVERHHVPHIHAEYQDDVAVFAIETGELLAGELPPNKHKFVEVWIEMRRKSLMENWSLAVAGRPLQNIRGLE